VVRRISRRFHPSDKAKQVEQTRDHTEQLGHPRHTDPSAQGDTDRPVRRRRNQYRRAIINGCATLGKKVTAPLTLDVRDQHGERSVGRRTCSRKTPDVLAGQVMERQLWTHKKVGHWLPKLRRERPVDAALFLLQLVLGRDALAAPRASKPKTAYQGSTRRCATGNGARRTRRSSQCHASPETVNGSRGFPWHLVVQTWTTVTNEHDTSWKFDTLDLARPPPI
jgi:hypothetical protein